MNLVHFAKSIIIDNYITFLAIDAIILLLTQKSYLAYIIAPILLYFIALHTHNKYQNKLIRILLICIWLSALFSWICNTYDHKFILILRFLGYDFAFMMAYSIGANFKTNEYLDFFEKMLLPVSILAVIGLWLFVSPPGWYTARAELSDNIMEALRLRSIFPSPYTLSYICCILLTYIFFRIVQYGTPVKKYKYYLPLLVITLLLCMQRAPIGGALIGGGGSLIYATIVKKSFKLLNRIILSVMLIFAFTYYTFNKVDNEMLTYLNDKIMSVTNNTDEFIEKRAGYSYMEVKESFVGDGAGKYSPWANNYNYRNMADGQYRKILQEQGVIGLAIYVLLWVVVLWKCYYYRKYLGFELCIMLFLMFSMMGANPFSKIECHSIVYWIIIGRVSAFRVSAFRITNKKNTRI